MKRLYSILAVTVVLAMLVSGCTAVAPGGGEGAAAPSSAPTTGVFYQGG